MMRNGLYLLLVACMMTACRTSKTAQSIGGQKDEHGCLVAAGYTWSDLKKDCVRLFDEAEKVSDPANPEEITTYVLFSTDNSKAELFRPSTKGSEIMIRNGQEWIGKSGKLRHESNGWVLVPFGK